MFSRSVLSMMTSLNARASESALRGSTNIPLWRSAITSGIAPTQVTTTASRAAIASIIAFGRPSAHDGSTKTSASCIASSRCCPSNQPRKRTTSLSSWRATSARVSAEAFPSPTMSSVNRWLPASRRQASINSKIPLSRSSQPRKSRRTHLSCRATRFAPISSSSRVAVQLRITVTLVCAKLSTSIANRRQASL